MQQLGHVRKLWEGILDFTSIIDVFKDEPIRKDAYDVDHFIPWSFVMNDELWNLMPMDASLNSVKSNRLPQWDRFFMRFANNQFTKKQDSENYMSRVIRIIYIQSGRVRNCIEREIPEMNFTEY